MKHKLYTRLLSLALAVGLVIGMLPSAAAVDTVGGSAGQAATFADPDSPLKLDKTVTDNENNTYTVNLEAYTTGTVTSTEESVPADIVLVLDESGSMDYDIGTSPVYSGQLDTSKTYYQINGDNARSITYNTRYRSWGYSGWFGAWNPITPTTGPDDTNENHVQLYESYSTRETAIVNAVNSFLDEISKDNANLPEDVTDHRVAMIGFSGENSARTIRSLTTQLNHISTSTLNTSGGTYINYGLQRVDDVFAAGSNAVAGEKRNRVVVVFTDGNPGSGNETNEDHSHAAQAVNTANTIKKSVTEGGCGATIFTVGIFTGADPSDTSSWPNKYMNGMSSNYANAVGEEGEYHYSWGGYWDPEPSITLGTQTQNANYYLSASDTEALNDIFETIADQTSSPSISLGEDAQVIDEVTQYFDLPSNDGDITIQQADYNGSSFEAAYKAPSTVQARIEGQKVIVTGFDFDKNFVTSTAKQDGTYGKKLIISFTITPDPEFWGGNKVPTNVLATSGVTDSSGVLAGNFPDPGTQDVPLKEITLTGKDVNVYYGGATPSAADLVTINPEYPDDWRTDYVNAITYSTNNTISNTQDGSYTVTATLSPKNPGTYSDETATAAATVNVFKPEITWQDSSNVYGTALTNEFLAGHNTKVEWKHDTADSSSVTMFGDVPALTYEFTDETNAALDTLKKETNVKVTSVKSNNVVVPNVSFKWQAGAECSGCTDPNSAYQFRIHMATSHTDEYPVRFYLEGVGSGAPNYPFIDDWAKLDAVFSGGYVAIPSANTCVYSNDLVVPNGTHQASDTITGNDAVAQWLTDNQAMPNLTVSDIKTALESLVALGNLSENTVLETVGNTQYTVADILASPEDFELRYTQVAENTDVIQEYYKGNRNGMYQQSYHVHLTVVRKPGDLTITKTFEGIDTPPIGFNIQVKDGNTVIETLTLGNADSNQNGIYTWIITDIPEATYTIIENGTDVTDMVLHATFEGATTSTGTTATIDVTGGVDKTVAITNSYSAADGKLNINKVVTEFANNGKPVFDFKLTSQADGTVYYYHVDMTGTEVNQAKPVASVTLPVGEYTIEELSNQNYTLKSVEVGGSSIKNGGTITIDPNGTTTVTFTNDAKNTNIPTDGSATENKVLEIKDGVIAWKQEPVQYGNDPEHENITPDPDPAE